MKKGATPCNDDPASRSYRRIKGRNRKLTRFWQSATGPVIFGCKLNAMQKLLTLLAFCFPFLINAQNIGIGTNTPDASALLDISSTQKGLLVPRMSSTERASILSPAVGLVVFDNTTYSFWVFRGDINGGWQELITSLDKHWDRLGANVYNTNNGNVGIGTNTPPQKLSINDINPVIQLINDGTPRGFLSLNGANIKLATNPDNTTGSLILATQGADRITITKAGSVGIGTSTPNAMLTVNTANPGIQLQSDVTNIGFIRGTNTGLFRIGTNSTNTLGNLTFQTREIDRVTIDENGQVGIGTTTPTSILSINATDPIVQLKNGGVDKGFIQLVSDDLKMGTNISNTFGTVILRTKGTDRLFVNYKGQMGLNTIPNDTRTTFSISSDENSNCGLELITSNSRRGAFSFNGTNTFLTSSAGALYIYRNSSNPFVAFSDGNFSIGDDVKATGYRLSVNGKTIATEFTALPIASWPDYVFEKNYQLRPLGEVRKFIEDNSHLPGIPSAAQIEKEGIQLGDMSKRLMEKVEELTLYILQLQDQIDALKKVQDAKSN